MEEIYSNPKAMVLHGDALELLEALKDDAVDHIITDPPYTEHVQKNVRSCKTNGPVKVMKYDLDFDPLENYRHAVEGLRVARRWSVHFCALEQLGEYCQAVGGHWKPGGHFVRSGIWRKKQAAPQLSGDRPANSCEGLAILHKRLPKGERLAWNGRGKHAFWRSEGEPDAFDLGFYDFGRERARKRHPAQKPVDLCRELVRQFTMPGETILDLFSGSGAIGVAAILEGRNIIAIDSDRCWAKATAEAFKAAEASHATELEERLKTANTRLDMLQIENDDLKEEIARLEAMR